MNKALVLALALQIASIGTAETLAVSAASSKGFLSPEERTEIVTGALDELFMEGFIVTSTENPASGAELWSEPRLASARAGFVDYLLDLEPLAEPAGGGKPELAGLRYRLYAVADGRSLAEGRVEAAKTGLPSLAERSRGLRALGSEAAKASIDAAGLRITGGW